MGRGANRGTHPGVGMRMLTVKRTPFHTCDVFRNKMFKTNSLWLLCGVCPGGRWGVGLREEPAGRGSLWPQVWTGMVAEFPSGSKGADGAALGGKQWEESRVGRAAASSAGSLPLPVLRGLERTPDLSEPPSP